MANKRLIPPPLYVYVLLLIFSVIAAVIWWHQQQKPVQVGSDEVVTFIVPRGASVDTIAQKLKAESLIRSPLAFKAIVAKEGISRQMQAGSFKLSPSQDASQIALALTKGTQDSWITLLEGWRREEIAAAIDQTLSKQGGQFDIQEFLSLTQNQEGYLFPDTYLIPSAADAKLVSTLLTKTFEQKVSAEPSIQAAQPSREDIVIMASLIEREAKTDQARRMVSGILWKRLANDWPLQVDATLQYAKGYDSAQDTWWPTPLASDKELNSPYNTYQNLGLPPTPIANPSLSSLRAAANPIDSEYWYYITDLSGEMHYASTLEQHNQNIQDHLR